jgi:hypothetical protein
MCVLALVAVIGSGILTPGLAQARPKYYQRFRDTYDKLDPMKVADLKCGICHGGDKGSEKQKVSKFGKELSKALGKRDAKEDEEIKKALKEIESKDAGDGKTYGDLLKDGKFPPGVE